MRRCNLRAQSHVVGVVLLLGITAVALGGLTSVVGDIVDGQSAAADEARVASTLSEKLRPTEQTGPNRVRIRFSEGRLRTVDRQLRILNDTGIVREMDISGLVYSSGTNRVSFVSGGVVRGNAGNAWLVRGPPVTVTRDNKTLVVGAAFIEDRGGAVGGTGGVTAELRTNITHKHQRLASDEYRIAIETRTPAPLERQFQSISAATTITDIDSDGAPSDIASVNGTQELHLVEHRMGLEINNG